MKIDITPGRMGTIPKRTNTKKHQIRQILFNTKSSSKNNKNWRIFAKFGSF